MQGSRSGKVKVDDLWAHPITVATYVALLSLSLAGARALLQLFQRVSHLEQSIADLHDSVNKLAVDLRAHMVEETRNVQHLERSISNIASAVSSTRIGLQD
jgi:hypothetical protein